MRDCPVADAVQALATVIRAIAGLAAGVRCPESGAGSHASPQEHFSVGTLLSASGVTECAKHRTGQASSAAISDRVKNVRNIQSMLRDESADSKK
ncbi:MAG: hypothetical protein WBD31_07000 [Rubripirellula sp.]